MGYKTPRTYTIVGVTSTSDPADSTTYYFGGPTGNIGIDNGGRRCVIPISGIIRQVQVDSYAFTIAGSAEDWMFSIFDGTTDTPIATVGSVGPKRTFRNANLNYAVTEGGYIQCKTTTPAWVTNPTGVYYQFIIVIEYE